MARDNGGIIGPVNDPTNTSASGVWSLEEQYQAQLAGNWPSAPAPFSTNSLRFDDGSSDYLSRTPSSAGNTKTLTISMWVKLSAITTNRHLICEEGGGTDKIDEIKISNADVIRIENYNDTGSDYGLVTNQVFRDVSAWYNIVVAFDSTQATAADRIKLYVNGSQVTSFSSSSYPSLNYDFYWNSNTDTIGIGADTRSPTNYFDGYMSEVILVDGQQLDATSFGVSDANGVWTPIKYEGTFGTNGFQLQFGNSAALGTDSSPNGNDFTVNNLTSIDQTTDYPVNNFATYNSLIPSTIVYSEGNCEAQRTTTDWEATASTISVTQGKWYAEFKSLGSNARIIGIEEISLIADWQNQYMGISSQGIGYAWDGRKFVSGTSSSYGSTYTTNDIVGVAVDMDNKFVYFHKNGTYQNSGDPTSGATGTGGLSFSGTEYVIGVGLFSSTIASNYGNAPYTISSGNSDANGYGNFEYAVPSGYYALNTKNLAEYG